MNKKLRLSLLLLLSATACVPPGQRPQFGQPPVNQASITHKLYRVPLNIKSCELDDCENGNPAQWSFAGDGTTGEGDSVNGAKYNLNTQQYNDLGVLIYRQDMPQSVSPAAHAVYRGVRVGGHIEGTVTLTRAGKTVTGPWKADAIGPGQAQQLQNQVNQGQVALWHRMHPGQ